MIVRELRSDEFKQYRDTILELLIETYSVNFDLSSQEATIIGNEKVQELEQYFQEGSATILAAITSDMLAGFLWVFRYDFLGEPRLHFNHMVVPAQYRGNGIARKLMKEGEKLAQRVGIETIDFYVSESNVAIRMYIELGYQTERRHMKKTVSRVENAV